MNRNRDALSLKKRLVHSLFPLSSRFLDRMNRVHRFVQRLEAEGDVPIWHERDHLYRYVAERTHGAPIDYLEFGVYQGHSISWWAQNNRCAESRFWGFDSFDGLPENWDGLSVGHFTTGGNIPKLDDVRVKFHKGWFQDTLDAFLNEFTPKNRLIINNDSDLYSSTLFTLTKLDKLLVPGTIIIFDEWDDLENEFRAHEDYCAAYLKSFKLIAGVDRFRTAAFEICAK